MTKNNILIKIKNFFNKIYQFYTKKFCIGKIIVKNMREINVSLLPPLSTKNTFFFNQNLLLIFGIFLSYLFLTQIASCHPLFLILNPALNYFSGISPEFYVGKAIDKLFEYSPLVFSTTIQLIPYAVWGTGSIVVGTVGLTLGIKAAEFGYNWRYFANSYALNTPFIGSVLKTYNSTYRWWYKHEVPQIAYIDFFNEIARKTGISLNINNNTNFSVEPVIFTVPIETQTTITQVEPFIVNKHSEDVQLLTSKINELNNTILQLGVQQANLKTENEIRLELEQLAVMESWPTLSHKVLTERFFSFNFNRSPRDGFYFLTKQPLQLIKFKLYDQIEIFYNTREVSACIILRPETFAELFPTIYSVASTLCDQDNWVSTTLIPSYDTSSGFMGLTQSYKLNVDNCIFRQLVGYGDLSETSALLLIKQHQESQVPRIHSEITQLTDEIKEIYQQSLRRNNPQDESLNSPSFELDQEELTIPEPVSVTTQTIGGASAVGSIILYNNPDLLLILSYLLMNEGLLPLLHNTEVVNSIFDLYSQTGLEIPQMFRETIDRAQSTDFVAYGTNSNSNSTINVGNTNQTGYSSFGHYAYLMGGLILVTGIVVGSIYLYKETKDPEALKPTLDVVDSLKDYTNFK